jgi:hypothetical protein
VRSEPSDALLSHTEPSHMTLQQYMETALTSFQKIPPFEPLSFLEPLSP